MARLDKAAIVAALSTSLPATVDETGAVDLVGDKGHINVAADPKRNVPAATRANTPPRFSSFVLIAVRPNPRPPQRS